MSRGVKGLHEIICVSRLVIRDDDDVISNSDEDIPISSRSLSFAVNGKTLFGSPVQQSADVGGRPDSGFSSSAHLSRPESANNPSAESEMIHPVNDVSRRGCSVRGQLARTFHDKSGEKKDLVDRESNSVNSRCLSSTMEMREGFVRSHNGDFDNLLTYIDGTVVAEWLTAAEIGRREMSAWCSVRDNFVKFAHFWIAEFPARDRVAMLRLERELLRDQIGFAFVSSSDGSACEGPRSGDISAFLSAVLIEYPRQLLSGHGQYLFLDHLSVLTGERDDKFRQLLTNVRCATNVKQFAQWTLATRSFCLVSLWSAVINFYRKISGDAMLGKSKRGTSSQDDVSAWPDPLVVDNTRMFSAIRLGYVDVVHYLLSSVGVSPCLCDADGRSLVFHAVVNKQTPVLHYLLRRAMGLDVNQPASSGNTPLHAAVNSGNVEIIAELLRAKEININPRNTQCNDATPLHMAIIHGNLEAVRLLLDAGADPLLTTESRNALDLAREFELADVVLELEERSATINDVNNAKTNLGAGDN